MAMVHEMDWLTIIAVVIYKCQANGSSWESVLPRAQVQSDAGQSHLRRTHAHYGIVFARAMVMWILVPSPRPPALTTANFIWRYPSI